MQICDRQNRHLRYFDFLTDHIVTSIRLASDSSFDFRRLPNPSVRFVASTGGSAKMTKCHESAQFKSCQVQSSVVVEAR